MTVWLRRRGGRRSPIPYTSSKLPDVAKTAHLKAAVGARATFGAYATRCIAILGAELTAYLVGADSVYQLEAWLADQNFSDDRVSRRLTVAHEVVNIFAARNIAALAASWLREVTNGFDAPARIIRMTADDDSAAKTVLVAATSWVLDESGAVV